MIGQVDNHDIKRKTIAILKILHDSHDPLGGRVIARQLSDIGIDLGESYSCLRKTAADGNEPFSP